MLHHNPTVFLVLNLICRGVLHLSRPKQLQFWEASRPLRPAVVMLPKALFQAVTWSLPHVETSLLQPQAVYSFHRPLRIPATYF